MYYDWFFYPEKSYWYSKDYPTDFAQRMTEDQAIIFAKNFLQYNPQYNALICESNQSVFTIYR